MAQLRDRRLLERSIQMLYVQALLLGHHSLSAREMALLNEGLLGLIEWGVDAHGREDS
jgi:molecular chaperone HtpG